MSPRKERYNVPEYIAQAIRNKRRKLLCGIYYCPKCGKDKLRIEVDRERKEVVAICSCGVEHQLNYVPAFESVDYYNRFIDQFKKEQ